LDQKFLADLAATSGATTAASTGVTASAILSDLSGRLIALTPIGADSRIYWIVSPKLYKEISLVQGTGGYLMQGNKIGQITVVPSDAATSVATLVDARQIAASADDAIINVSSEASLQLSDSPTASDYQTVSLFASNLTAMQCEIWWCAKAVRGTAISMLTGYS
jgi:hypothetical protein